MSLHPEKEVLTRAFHLQVMEAKLLRLSGLFCVLPAAIKPDKPAPAQVPGQEESGQTEGGSSQRPKRDSLWPLPAPPSTGPAFAACRDPARAGAAQAGARGGRRARRRPQSRCQERAPLGVCSGKGLAGERSGKGLAGECSGKGAARKKAGGPGSCEGPTEGAELPEGPESWGLERTSQSNQSDCVSAQQGEPQAMRHSRINIGARPSEQLPMFCHSEPP